MLRFLIVLGAQISGFPLGAASQAVPETPFEAASLEVEAQLSNTVEHFLASSLINDEDAMRLSAEFIARSFFHPALKSDQGFVPHFAADFIRVLKENEGILSDLSYKILVEAFEDELIKRRDLGEFNSEEWKAAVYFGAATLLLQEILYYSAKMLQGGFYLSRMSLRATIRSLLATKDFMREFKKRKTWRKGGKIDGSEVNQACASDLASIPRRRFFPLALSWGRNRLKWMFFETLFAGFVGGLSYPIFFYRFEPYLAVRRSIDDQVVPFLSGKLHRTKENEF